MTEHVEGTRLYHVTNALPYNAHAPLRSGAVLSIGEAVNPFFGFYGSPRRFSVQTPEGLIMSPAMTYLRAAQEGRISGPHLLTHAVDTARHFMMLARELIMEEVRREEARDAPSRQRCLWTTDDIRLAEHWKARLGGAGKIVELEARGTILRVDAALLLGDAEALDETYRRARSYWRGEVSNSPEPELLFAGSATVLKVEGD